MRLTTKIVIDRWLGAILTALFAWVAVLRPRVHSVPQPRRIAVIKLLGLGNIIQATPLLAGLAQRYPDARITFVTTSSNVALAERIPGVAESLNVDDRSIIRLIRSLWRVLATLRAEPDLCIINLEAYSHLGALIAMASGARWKAGFFRNPADLQMTRAFDRLVYFNPAAPISDIYLQLGRALDVRSFPVALTRLQTNAADHEELRRVLAEHRLDEPGVSYVVFNPNASELRLERRWPADRFAALMEKVAAAYPDTKLVLVGSSVERSYVEGIARNVAAPLHARVVNLAGEIRLGGLIALLAGARLLVSNDSGPLHIGYSMGIPTLGLFGPVAPGHYASQAGNAATVALYHRTYCSPCVHHFDVAPCRGDNVCLKGITVDDAYGAVRWLLSGEGVRPCIANNIVYTDAARPIGVAGTACGEMPCRNLLAYPLVSRRDLTVRFCPNCGVGYADPFPDHATLAGIYGAHYYDSWDLRDGGKATADMKRATFRRRLVDCSAWLPRGARVLDLGCATGYFLEEAVAAGLAPFGVDIESSAIAQCEQKFGAGRFYCGEFEQAQFAANSDGVFDAIFMSDYLEHVRDPKTVLQHTVTRLAPGGIVVVTAPDVASLTRYLMGSRWPHFKVEHLWYFTANSLARLLEDAGLHVVKTGSATKTLTLSYLAAQFRHYPHPLATPLLNGLMAVLPAALAHAHLRIPTGEITIVARKPA